MNARFLLLRAALPAALSLTVALAGAHAQEAPAAPQPTAPQPTAEDAPIDKFDLAASIMAESGGLTADEAATKARARAPQIASARASADVAEQDADTAWDQFLPQLNGVAQYKRVNLIPIRFTLPGTMPAAGDDRLFEVPVDQWSVQGSARYAVSDVFLRAWPAYKSSVSAAEAQKTQAEVSSAVVSLNARIAFYDYARALAERAVADQALKQAEAQANQIQLFVGAGTSARVDHLTATARVEEARSGLANADARVNITQSNLAVLTGLKAEEVRGIAEPVLDAPPAPATPVDDLLRKALEHRAELRALRKTVAASDRAHVAQKRSGLPQLILSANYLSAQPNARYIPINRDRFRNSWEVGAGIEWSPNSTLASVRATRRANAQLEKARADLLAQEDAVRNEVVSAYQNYKSAEAVSAASHARLEAAEEAYRVRLATYRVGAGVIVDLLNADLEVSRARLAMANAAINTRAALATLDRAAALKE